VVEELLTAEAAKKGRRERREEQKRKSDKGNGGFSAAPWGSHSLWNRLVLT
jgi:hypothetical protein